MKKILLLDLLLKPRKSSHEKAFRNCLRHVERLSAWNLGTGLLHFLGARKLLNQSYRIPWNQIDLSNPDRPHLMCTVDELKELSRQLEANESQKSTS
jgi:hypothetical protein